MNIFNIFNILVIINNVFIESFHLYMNKNTIQIKNSVNKNIIQIKKEFKNDLTKMSLLSKLIYDYDYISDHNHNHKKNLNIQIDNNIKMDLVKKNNIYFNFFQFMAFLENKDFKKYQDKYFKLLNNFYKNIEIYGYFLHKNRLHSLILLNEIDKEIIVVFRGSQYNDEWIKNLFFFEKEIEFDDEKHRIHSGIYNSYINNNIDNNLINILKDLFNNYPNYRKIFTGHSKGNINCILLAFELNKKLNKNYIYDIFGFGSPPIFNYELGMTLQQNKNINIYNIINDQDIIPFLPICDKYHIGKEILLKDNKIIINSHHSPYKLNNKINYYNLFRSILNHDLNLYIKNIMDGNIP